MPTYEPPVRAMKYHGPGFAQETDDYELMIWLPQPVAPEGSPNPPRTKYALSYRVGWDGDDWTHAEFEYHDTAEALLAHLNRVPQTTLALRAAVVAEAAATA